MELKRKSYYLSFHVKERRFTQVRQQTQSISKEYKFYQRQGSQKDQKFSSNKFFKHKPSLIKIIQYSHLKKKIIEFFDLFNDLKIIQLIKMNQAKQFHMVTRKDNLHNISQAFRKLLDKVQVRMHSPKSIKSITRSSLSVKRSQNFFKSKKNSMIVSHRRKNSYFSQATPQSPTKSLKIEFSKCSHSKQFKLINTSKQNTNRSGRCYTASSISNHSDIYNKIASYNDLLITKTYLFQDINSNKSTKNVKEQRIFRKTQFNDSHEQVACQKFEYQSRIKNGQKNKRLHAVQKKKEVFQKFKQQPQGDAFEPWETDKAQQFFFIAQ